MPYKRRSATAPLQVNKGISHTSLCCGVLTRFAVEDFFTYELLNARKQENYYQRATYEDKVSTFPQPSAVLIVQETNCLNAIVTMRSAYDEPLEVCPRGTEAPRVQAHQTM